MNNNTSDINYNTLTYSELYENMVDAVINGDLNKVKKILSIDRSYHESFLLRANGPLAIASNYGQLEIMQHIFKKVNVDFTLLYPELLVVAAHSKQRSVINYLLNSPDLIEKPDIHYDNDELFRKSCNNLDMIRYFIFDLNIERTERINMYLQHLVLNPPNNGKEIIKMFEKRELAQSLKLEMTPETENKVDKKLKL